MQTPVAANLPGGFWNEGVRYRQAELRPLNGHDESLLVEVRKSAPPAQLATFLLSRCVSRLGNLSPVRAEHMRDLAVGDREALLLQLRGATLGERMQCVVQCPAAECGEKMDLELRVSDLLVPAYEQWQQEYESVVDSKEGPYRVQFRLPTGRDVEAAVPLAHQDVEAAEEFVLRRCITRLSQECPADNSASLSGPLPKEIKQTLAGLMEKLDPQAELMFSLVCPSCRANFQICFDPASYLLHEIMAEKEQLYRQVHLLGFHYHWSEPDIMAMTPSKRKLYLRLLAEELAARRRN